MAKYRYKIEYFSENRMHLGKRMKLPSAHKPVVLAANPQSAINIASKKYRFKKSNVISVKKE